KTARITALVLWLLATVLAVVTMPDMEQLVREKGQISIPDSFQSVVADEMAKDLSGEGDRYELIAVFNSGNGKALSETQKEEIRSVIDGLESDRKKLGITDLSLRLTARRRKRSLRLKITQRTLPKFRSTRGRAS